MNDKYEEQSFVERHARQRLHKVEKEKRKPYVKKNDEDHGISGMQVIMQILMVVVLISMILSIL